MGPAPLWHRSPATKASSVLPRRGVSSPSQPQVLQLTRGRASFSPSLRWWWGGAFLSQPPHHTPEEGQGQLSCTPATRASSPMLPRQGEEPALPNVPSREGQDQLSTVLRFQRSLRWQPRPRTSTWSLVVTQAWGINIHPRCSRITDPDMALEAA